MEVSAELSERLLFFVHSGEYRPSKVKQIAAALKLDQGEAKELRRVVKFLIARGDLSYGPSHIVLTPAQAEGKNDSVRGAFRSAIGGFGFVRPNSGGTEADAPDDIFIPPGQTMAAMDGDVVEVQIGGRRGVRRSEGRVTKILSRGRRQFTGTYQPGQDTCHVFLDGVHFDAPVAVGDNRGLPLEPDDKVVVEMVEYPDATGQGGQAVIVEVLGSSKNPAIDTLTIMRQYGLPESFPEGVIDAARQAADQFVEGEIPPDRKDLTELLTITIDPFDARDFDDAISLRYAEGRWTLWVHIADVTAFVAKGGAIDQEARRRATSVYLPDRVIPMIPEIISNHLASLQPERNRFSKTVELEFLEDGTITSTEVYNAVIRSDLRLNYEQVDQFLAAPESFQQKWGVGVCEQLANMHRLAMGLRRRRIKRGALTLDLPEIKLDLDKSGKVRGASVVKNTESHQIIEEFMLAANEAVATWLDDLELRFLHRIHSAPERRKLRQLSQFLKDLGIRVDDIESRFEIQRVIDEVSGMPLEQAVNLAVLRSMSKAVYGPHRDGHYALDMEHYCHFTSPIRRYPDLMIHRLVQNVIGQVSTPDEPFAMLLREGHHCSDQERNAEQAERELVLLKLLHHLKKHVGETMPAIINRVYPDGFYARCTDLPVEGYISVSRLPADQYRYERRGHVIEGTKLFNRFRLGDQLTIRIARVDVRERELFFDLVKNHTVSGERGKPPKKRLKDSNEVVGAKSLTKKNRKKKKKKKG